MKSISDKTNIDLKVIFLADPLQIYHYKYPKEGYDFNYPNKRLSKFCNIKKINCFDSLPFFIKYLEKNNLEPPFFSFEDDGHYSKIGHEVMFLFLIEKVWEITSKNIIRKS